MRSFKTCVLLKSSLRLHFLMASITRNDQMTLCYPFCQSRSECCAWAPLTNVLLNFLPCMVFSLTFHLHEIGPQSMFAACCTKTVIKHGVPQAVRMAGVSGGLVLIENQTANYVEKSLRRTAWEWNSAQVEVIIYIYNIYILLLYPCLYISHSSGVG